MFKIKVKIKYFLVVLLAAIATFLGIVGSHSYSEAKANANFIAARAGQGVFMQPPAPVVMAEARVDNPSLQKAGLTLEEVGQGIYSLVASTDFPPQPGLAICNAGIVIGSDGVLIIDAFQSEELAQLVFSTVKTLTDKPVKYVLNTHYHFDHTGGNLVASKLGIPIIGRGVIREYIQSGRLQTAGVIPPTVIVNSQTDIWLGDRQVRIERVDGHSAGTDLVAYVPDAKVLFSGDMLFNKRIPFTGDSDIRQWQGSLYRLIATYPEAKVVPGHGPITDVSGLQTQQAYFSTLERTALEWKAQILSKEQALSKYARIPDPYQGYKFQALYTGNLDSAYEQFTRSATIPLIP
ncbi:MBL fold metallo-hydrolase [Tumidithrix elongata RA019]|uniref:MBL fold metallo-hydrolase n=1 Tax=Tumidithrix elongata BACA0141 TaxID=2716417 RepID=A0AAW9PWJ5_9CYAN|nr:MBL fold metallo-hydrolase [Tumidithrix elongata RA019]